MHLLQLLIKVQPIAGLKIECYEGLALVTNL